MTQTSGHLDAPARDWAEQRGNRTGLASTSPVAILQGRPTSVVLSSVWARTRTGSKATTYEPPNSRPRCRRRDYGFGDLRSAQHPARYLAVPEQVDA